MFSNSAATDSGSFRVPEDEFLFSVILRRGRSPRPGNLAKKRRGDALAISGIERCNGLQLSPSQARRLGRGDGKGGRYASISVQIGWWSEPWAFWSTQALRTRGANSVDTKQ
jgi:hypothetical protein